MSLRSFDLNLLLTFDAIYSERSISKAANKLSLSQPTVSNALARLRIALDDPLFVRSAQGMVPNSKAKALAEPVRLALLIIERGLGEEKDFSFSQSSREFAIAVEDYGEVVILPRFVNWLSVVAPQIKIRIRAEPSASLKTALKDGAVDLALDYYPIRDPDYVNKCVTTETLLTLSRRDHPMIGDKLNLESFLALGQVIIEPRPDAIPLIDAALAKRGLKRQVTVTVTHFMSMPLIVQASDMIATMPRRMALLYASCFHVRAHALPLRSPQLPVYLIWHKSAEVDSGHQWFRNQLIDLCERL